MTRLFLTFFTIIFFPVVVWAQPIPENTLTARDGLPNFFAKLKANKPVTVVYFGGSITGAGIGYRVQTEKWFRETWPSVSFTMVNSAIGGTGSDLGVVRVADDVLAYHPDLVFVEFSVNDGGADSLSVVKCMEGIVRKIWKQDLATDICFLYTTAETQFPTNLKGRHWLSARVSERIADYYGIPSISMDFAVAKLAKEDKLILKGDKDKDYGGKIVFTNDAVHPTGEGHEIYTKTIVKAFDAMAGQKVKVRKQLGKASNADNYEYSGMYPATQARLWGNWQQLGQGNEVYDRLKSRAPEIIKGSSSNEQLIVKFKGKRIGFFDIVGPSTGKLTVRIDDSPPITIQRFDKYCTYYRNHYFWLPELEDGEHVVTLTVDPTPIDKKSILMSEPTDEVRKYLTKMDIYLSKIMLIGEMLPMVKETRPPYQYPVEPEVVENLREWQDLKFGLFMHWGAYSQWGIVESWSISPEDYNFIKRPEGSNYFDYVKEYENLIKTFNPVKFDPQKWADAAKEAGMKYVVFTTKHHDGFNMFDTKQSDYKITGPECPFRTNPKANISKEVFNAFRKEQFKIGAYFSISDWHNNDYWWDYFPPTGRHINYSPDKYPEKWQHLNDFINNQLVELVNGDYGKVDILWFDLVGVHKEKQVDMERFAKSVRSYQPQTMMVARYANNIYENYRTPEQKIPEQTLDYPWETCMTIADSWSYKPGDQYKSAWQLIQYLVQVVSRGGNFLLNVGPSPEGEWDPTAYERLKEIGAWMKINGESIYGTKPVYPYHETKIAFTQKGNDVYATYLPDQDEKNIPSRMVISSMQPQKGSKLYLLGHQQPLSWENNGKGVIITIPASLQSNPPCQHAWTFKMQVK